jgi:hypothetical protein
MSKQQAQQYIEKVLFGKLATRENQLALFTFDEIEPDELAYKFGLWARFLFPKFFSSKDAPFHEEMDLALARLYLGEQKAFVNIGFRGCAKTTRGKMFRAFVIANDLLRRRKYHKILSEDNTNSKQYVTDVYNLLIDPKVRALYPGIFKKTEIKREETMTSFTTATGIKVLADTVGSSQRGQIQEEARPDWVTLDDFENRKTLRSLVITHAIWLNMEEAKDGLAVDGVIDYLGQYLSEAGNMHKLIKRHESRNEVLRVPIVEQGRPTWPERYSEKEIQLIKRDAEDWEGEYLCQPEIGSDILFDREKLEKMEARIPIREIAGFKIYIKYDASHRYAGGGDVGGGVGLDHSASVFIDFDTIPAQIVGTFKDNTIKPEVFGDELARQGDRFGGCLLAPEKNGFGQATVARLKQIYDWAIIFQTPRKDAKASPRVSLQAIEYGWETNALTKPKMIFALAKAVEDGHIELNDPDLIEECKSYTRNDLMDKTADVRLTTRHFDLLTAAAIAWQMKDYAVKKEEIAQEQEPYQPISEYEVVPEKRVKQEFPFGGRNRYEMM